MSPRVSGEVADGSIDRPGLTRGSLSVRAVAEGTALFASAATVLWVARVLGPENLGLLAVALTTLAFAQALSDFGLPSLGAQLVVSDPSSAGRIYRHVTLWRAAGAIALGLLIGTLAALPFLNELRWYLMGAAIAVVFHPFNAGWLLVALGSIKRASIVRSLGVIVTLVAVVFAIRTPDDAEWGVLVLIVPLFVSGAVSIVLLRFGFRTPPADAGVPAEISLKETRHYALADLSLLMYTYADRLILYVVAGPLAVGLYDAAHRLIQPFYAISVVVREAYFVDLARGYGRSTLEETLNSFVRLMCIMTIPIGPFLTLFAGLLVDVFYGARYAGAVPILAILGWTISIGFVSGIVVLPFLAWNRGREYGWALLVGNLTNLAVNVLAIPAFGGVGAAIASVSSNIVVAGHGWRTFHKTSGYRLAPRVAPFLGASFVAASLSLAVRLTGGTDLAAAGVFVAGYGASVLTWWVRRARLDCVADL